MPASDKCHGSIALLHLLWLAGQLRNWLDDVSEKHLENNENNIQTCTQNIFISSRLQTRCVRPLQETHRGLLLLSYQERVERARTLFLEEFVWRMPKTFECIQKLAKEKDMRKEIHQLHGSSEKNSTNIHTLLQFVPTPSEFEKKTRLHLSAQAKRAIVDLRLVQVGLRELLHVRKAAPQKFDIVQRLGGKKIPKEERVKKHVARMRKQPRHISKSLSKKSLSPLVPSVHIRTPLHIHKKVGGQKQKMPLSRAALAEIHARRLAQLPVLSQMSARQSPRSPNRIFQLLQTQSNAHKTKSSTQKLKR